MYSTTGAGAAYTAGAGAMYSSYRCRCGVRYCWCGRDVLHDRSRCGVHCRRRRDVLHHRCRCGVRYCWCGRDVFDDGRRCNIRHCWCWRDGRWCNIRHRWCWRDVLNDRRWCGIRHSWCWSDVLDDGSWCGIRHSWCWSDVLDHGRLCGVHCGCRQRRGRHGNCRRGKRPSCCDGFGRKSKHVSPRCVLTTKTTEIVLDVTMMVKPILVLQHCGELTKSSLCDQQETLPWHHRDTLQTISCDGQCARLLLWLFLGSG